MTHMKLSLFALSALAACLLAGCGSRAQVRYQAGLATGMQLTVASVVQRHVYLDATLVAQELRIRTFVPASELCRRVLEIEAQIEYVERGVGGQFRRQGEVCQAVGIGDPLISRGRRPRPSTAATIPRAQANFSTVYEDAGAVLLRGRFPLTSTVGWGGGHDTVAVVPNTAACRAPIERGVASIEFRAGGPNTLTLVSKEGTCRIEGLVQPLGGSAGEPAAVEP